MGDPRWGTPAAPSQTPQTGLRILYTNARSLVNKVSELKLYVLDTIPDVIAITETWTHSSISDNYTAASAASISATNAFTPHLPNPKWWQMVTPTAVVTYDSVMEQLDLWLGFGAVAFGTGVSEDKNLIHVKKN